MLAYCGTTDKAVLLYNVAYWGEYDGIHRSCYELYPDLLITSTVMERV